MEGFGVDRQSRKLEQGLGFRGEGLGVVYCKAVSWVLLKLLPSLANWVVWLPFKLCADLQKANIGGSLAPRCSCRWLGMRAPPRGWQHSDRRTARAQYSADYGS